MAGLISPVDPCLAPYQPSQRYLVLDDRHVGDDDLPSDNLMAAVIALEQSRSPSDLLRVVDALRERLQDPHDSELTRETPPCTTTNRRCSIPSTAYR